MKFRQFEIRSDPRVANVVSTSGNDQNLIPKSHNILTKYVSLAHIMKQIPWNTNNWKSSIMDNLDTC